MDFDTRVGAYGVVLQHNRLLLSLWDGPQHPVWTLPGGGMEPGESPELTCRREIEEETGYVTEVGELLGVTSRTIPTEARLHGQPRPMLAVQVMYRATVLSGELRAEENGSSIDACWMDLEEVVRRLAEEPHTISGHVANALRLAEIELPAPVQDTR